MSDLILTKPYSVITEHGQVVRTGRSMDLPRKPGCTTIGEEAPSLQHYYWGNRWHVIPDQPDKYHRWDWTVHQWLDDRTPEQRDADIQAEIDAKWNVVRLKRNKLIAASDWRVMPDAPTSNDMRPKWLEYRQALRDITDQPDPLNIQWPDAPQN